jgi:predicted nucleotidyltransferase
LLLDSARAYGLGELIERVGAGSGAVQRLLARLVDAEIVETTPQGKRRLYRANRHSPLFPDLSGLLRKTVGLGEPLREALAPLRERIVLAFVYGSMAKGTDRADSDVDIMVVGDDIALEELLAALDPTEHDLGRQIHPTLYTVADYDKRRRDKNPFLTKVLAGDRIDLIGAADASPEAR